MRQNHSNPLDHNLLGLNRQQVWDTGLAYQHLNKQGVADTRRTAERRLHALGLLPMALVPETLRDEKGSEPLQIVLKWELESARSRRQLVLFAQLAIMPDGMDCLHLNDGRGARYWIPLAIPSACQEHVINALQQMQTYLGKTISIFPHGRLIRLLRDVPKNEAIRINLLSHAPEPLKEPKQNTKFGICPPHLKRLEDRSIYLIREAVALAAKPAILFGGGKSSAVLLHLTRKAFFPNLPPMPLLHITNEWECRSMAELRKQMAQAIGMTLLEHPLAVTITKKNHQPEQAASLATEMRKEEGVQQALQHYQFDLLLDTARRDKNKFLQSGGNWNQIQEAGHRHQPINIHPLEDWTEFDIWHYIQREDLSVSSLYFSHERPVVERDGKLILIDDDRIKLMSGEQIKSKCIRLGSLEDKPELNTIISSATSPAEILQELTQILIHQPTQTERLR